MKQVEYTDKQKEIIEILKPFKELYNRFPECMDARKQLGIIINSIEEKNNIKSKLLTLREYLIEKSRGAYHNFIFRINNVDINVIGVNDFSRTFNDLLLDRYYVVDDKTESTGDNCENYNCNHYLTLEVKE
jgi:hypothetical protein